MSIVKEAQERLRLKKVGSINSQIEIWNAAIEAAVKQLKKEFVAPEVIIEIIRKVKK